MSDAAKPKFEPMQIIFYIDPDDSEIKSGEITVAYIQGTGSGAGYYYKVHNISDKMGYFSFGHEIEEKFLFETKEEAVRDLKNE